MLLSVAGAVLVVLAVVGAEIVARWWAPGYLVETRGLHVFSPTLGWAHREGVATTVEGKRVSVNARGYRGRELPLPRAAAKQTRVIVLGDSVAFGLGVSDDETFTHALDARDNGIEAVNLAVQGYGPGQELLVLQGEGLRNGPDVVVLAFCLANDFAEALLPVALYDGRTAKPRFRLVGERLVLEDAGLHRSGPERLLIWLSESSHLFNRTAALGPPAETAVGEHWLDRKREALRDEGYALRSSLGIVRRMDALSRERGARFILAAFPTRHSYRSRSWFVKQFLAALRAEGITVIDMAARFRAEGESFESVALDEIGHLSPRGHAVSADVLESEIAARDLSGRRPRRSPRTGAAAP